MFHGLMNNPVYSLSSALLNDYTLMLTVENVPDPELWTGSKETN
jgi:hypothetical protein